MGCCLRLKVLAVIGCVTMQPKRWPNWVIGLPVLFTLYRNRPDCDQREVRPTDLLQRQSAAKTLNSLSVRTLARRLRKLGDLAPQRPLGQNRALDVIGLMW